MEGRPISRVHRGAERANLQLEADWPAALSTALGPKRQGHHALVAQRARCAAQWRTRNVDLLSAPAWIVRRLVGMFCSFCVPVRHPYHLELRPLGRSSRPDVRAEKRTTVCL